MPLESRDIIARPANSIQRPELKAAPSAPNLDSNGRNTHARPTTSSGALETSRGTPSIRSHSSMSSHTVSSNNRPRSATPASVKSLWSDSTTVVDLSETAAAQPQSPGKVYDEYPEIADASPAGSGANTPKFSRSALKKSGVTLPTAAPRPPSSRGASPLASPWHSPTSSKLTLGRSRSILSLDTSKFATDRTPDCSSPESETERSDYFGGFGQIQTSGDLSTLPRAFRPNLRSKLSSASLASSFSASTYKTAYEPTTPPNEPLKVDPTHTSSSTESSNTLSPVLSHNSTSDGTHTYSESGTTSSEGTHSQASSADINCFGHAKMPAKKSGGMKRFLRMFGMTTKTGNSMTVS
jgi:hypothetical protein